MTVWSTPALLLLGIALGPYGLNLLSPSILLVLDPGIAMTLAMLGVFVGLSFESGHSRMPRQIAAGGLRTITTIAAVGAAAFAAWSFWIGPGSPMWMPALMLGVCAAVSDVAADVNIDDVLMILAGSFVVAALREAEVGPLLLLMLAVAGISIVVAFASWLLVGQTDSVAEQHVFVVGALLLLGGAAAYLSLSTVVAGLMAGLVWSVAGNVAKARIIRDLHYFQHPLVVLVLVSAGAGAILSVETMALAVIFVAVRTLSRPVGAWMARRLTGDRPSGESEASLISAGLVGIALALDVFRADSRVEWGAMLVGAVVLGTIISGAVALFVPVPVPSAVPGGAR